MRSIEPNRSRAVDRVQVQRLVDKFYSLLVPLPSFILPNSTLVQLNVRGLLLTRKLSRFIFRLYRQIVRSRSGLLIPGRARIVASTFLSTPISPIFYGFYGKIRGLVGNFR